MTFNFRPASSILERAGLFVSLTGGTNSGKTFSALRLARGIAGPNGRIAVLDTEGGRTLHLKRDFEFDVDVMDPPFRPERFSEAAKSAEAAKYDCLLIDSFSMEWVGIGGVLEWQAAEHQAMGGTDKTKGTSWIKPKMAHKAMVYSLLQRRIPIIFSIRGEETFVPPNTKLFKAITNKAFPFEVTVSFRLEADRKGYIDLNDPQSYKLEGVHHQIFKNGDRISEEHGRKLAEWARGVGVADMPLVASKTDRTADLIAEGQEHAERGMVALRAFLDRLTAAESDAIGGRAKAKEWAAIARKADADFEASLTAEPADLARSA